MGDGYIWNDNSTISSPAKTSSWNNRIEQNTGEKTLSTEAIVAGVSGDIAQSLGSSLAKTKPIYLAPVKQLNATTSVFDHKLRSKLSDQGYTLSSTPNESYVLAYDIKKTKGKDIPESTYDFVIFDISGEEPVIIETRTQEIKPIKSGPFQLNLDSKDNHSFLNND